MLGERTAPSALFKLSETAGTISPEHSGSATVSCLFTSAGMECLKEDYTCIIAMAELDLSLSDALMDSPPQPGLESKVERDFVAQLEAETFEDQVKETVGKTDYIPLLDNDDTGADAGAALENGEQEAHGVQKP
ncbi:hypothetical protein CHARACLAT_025221, partial [Characodon lateralis]|nr:hypothetical protein [Characodon lateralis]